MVVDITKRRDNIYIISQSHQRVTTRQAQPQSTTIQQLYNELPLDVGHIEWPDEATTEALADAIREGRAVGASDGSVREIDDKASHAWIISAPNGVEIVGKGPVDGTKQSRTSHRAELQGQTGLLLLMVTLLVQAF